MASPITFYLDYLSPYAYLAWTQIHALSARYGRGVEPVPALLAAMLANGQTKGPAEIPAKRAYLFKDVTRSARALGVKLAPPPSHPFNPLLALRVSSLPMDAGDKKRLVDALYAATWGGGEGVERKEQVARALEGTGLDVAGLIERAEREGKALLRAQTDAAIAAGVFGVPTMIVDGDMFWGLDSFAHLERHLAGERIDWTEASRAWLALRPTAQRKQASS